MQHNGRVKQQLLSLPTSHHNHGNIPFNLDPSNEATPLIRALWLVLKVSRLMNILEHPNFLLYNYAYQIIGIDEGLDGITEFTGAH